MARLKYLNIYRMDCLEMCHIHVSQRMNHDDFGDICGFD